MDLRMTYSAAVIRAINGLVDPSQKGLYADSVMSMAAAHGIPSWIVELRHDGHTINYPQLMSSELPVNTWSNGSTTTTGRYSTVISRD